MYLIYKYVAFFTHFCYSGVQSSSPTLEVTVRKLWVLIFLLAGCGGFTNVTGVKWRTPAPGVTLSGQVELIVEPLSEPPPPNAVFMVNGAQIAKVGLEGGIYRTIWDSSGVPAGEHRLAIKPYGEAASEVPIRVSRVAGVPTSDRPGEPFDEEESLQQNDPLNLRYWFGFIPGAASLVQQLPSGPGLSDLYPNRARAALSILAAQPLTLPRGVYSFDDELEDWVFTPGDVDELRIRFAYLGEEGVQHEVEVTLVWLATTQVSVWDDGGQVEAPEEVEVTVVDNDRVLGEATFAAAYAAPESCGPMLEPASFEVQGFWYGEEGSDAPAADPPADEPPGASPAQDQPPEAPPAEGDESEVPLVEFGEVSFEVAFSRIADEVTLYTFVDVGTTEDATFAAEFDLAATGQVVREGCTPTSVDIASLDWISVLEHVATRTDGNRLEFRLSEVDEENLSAELAGSLTTYITSPTEDEEELTIFEGTLDNPDGNPYPGENVTVTPPPSFVSTHPSTTLDVYLESLVESYRELYTAILDF